MTDDVRFFEIVRWLRDDWEPPETLRGKPGNIHVGTVVLWLLMYRNMATRQAWPVIETLARNAGLSASTVRRALHLACEIKLIRPVGRGSRGQIKYAFTGLERAVTGHMRTTMTTTMTERAQTAEAETDAENLPAGVEGPQAEFLPKPGDTDEDWAHNMALQACREWEITPGVLVVAKHIRAALKAGLARDEVHNILDSNQGQAVWDALGPQVKAKAKPVGPDYEALRKRGAPR